MSVWTPQLIQRSNSWTFQRLERTDDTPPRDVIAKQDYLSVNLHGIRLPQLRPGLKRFSCVVHSSVLMPSLEVPGGNTYFHSLFLPASLQNVAVEECGWDLELNACLLQSVPYRGGRVGVEIEVLCVPPDTVELLKLAQLERACQAADRCFVKQANELSSRVEENVAALVAIEDGVCLEAGVRHKCCSPQTGSFVQVGVHRQYLKLPLLQIDPEAQRLVDAGSQTQPYSTIVLSMEANTSRANWHQIPDIQRAYEHLQSSLSHADVELAFDHFQKVCLASPDIQPRDAQRLVLLVKDSFAEQSHAALPRLSDVPLFENAAMDSAVVTVSGAATVDKLVRT